MTDSIKKTEFNRIIPYKNYNTVKLGQNQPKFFTNIIYFFSKICQSQSFRM